MLMRATFHLAVKYQALFIDTAKWNAAANNLMNYNCVNLTIQTYNNTEVTNICVVISPVTPV